MRRFSWSLLLCLAGGTMLAAQEPERTQSAPSKPAAPAGEKLSVKIYPVADLVALPRSNRVGVQRGTMEEWAGAPQAAIEAGLNRLEKVLRLALPPESWEDGGGRGAILGYPETLGLLVRQTDAGQQAIADLLKQLRQTNGLLVELKIEALNLKNSGDGFQRLIGMELSADELAGLRKHAEGDARTIRAGNGRTVDPLGMFGGGNSRMTVVASHDHKEVEINVDTLGGPTSTDNQPILWISQTYAVAAGQTVAVYAGNTLWLVTPRILPENKADGAPKTAAVKADHAKPADNVLPSVHYLRDDLLRDSMLKLSEQIQAFEAYEARDQQPKDAKLRYYSGTLQAR